MAVSIGLMDAEPERPGRLGRKLLGSACDLSALLSDGFELAPRMRGGQYHDLGHRLRLQHVLRVLEDRVDVGLSGREDFELVFPESLGGL